MQALGGDGDQELWRSRGRNATQFSSYVKRSRWESPCVGEVVVVAVVVLLLSDNYSRTKADLKGQALRRRVPNTCLLEYSSSWTAVLPVHAIKPHFA